ncbi:hypothetical protein NL676_024301 [Syzygium grande]|nr:hypothetical protein NL676_024301 [Syzygium grande]
MPREADPFWRYVEVVENNKRRCIFCRNECAGGATRIKAHLAGVPGYGIKGCERVENHVKEKALKAITGASVSDPSRAGGTSGEGRETKCGGGSHALFPCNHSPNSNDVLNSNQHTCVSQQPSCHWQTGSDAAATHPQHHLVLPYGEVSLDDLDFSWQPNQSHRSFDAEHGDENALSFLQSSIDWLASLPPDSYDISQLFYQSVNLDIGDGQQHPRASSSLQMNDQQTPAWASSSEYNQSPDVGNQSRITSVTNTVPHSHEPLPSCNEECGAETSSFPVQDSVGIYPPIALQPTRGPHYFEATRIDSQVLEGGANVAHPSSSPVQLALVPPQHQSVPHQSITHETRNAEQNPTMPSSSWKNHLVTNLPTVPMDTDQCILLSSQAPNNAPLPELNINMGGAND